jgi:hypothetical protein
LIHFVSFYLTKTPLQHPNNSLSYHAVPCGPGGVAVALAAVAVAADGGGSGSGSGWVAVAVVWLDRAGYCGHFDTNMAVAG